MEKIEWCKKQIKGIRIINPNENIANSYIKKAEESLIMIEKATPSWKIICAYYACYDMLYALYMKTGIKCEIHDCSIELMKIFNFEEENIDFFEKLKEDRINVQYYITEKIPTPNLQKIKKIILKIKEKIFNLSETEINRIREKINK